MKKRLLFLGIVLMLMVLGGCSTKQEVDKNTPTAEATVKQSNIPEMKLNEPFAVKTENGNYTLTVRGAAIDTLNTGGEKKIRLDYSYSNESFGDESKELLISGDGFQVLDDSGVIFNTYTETSGYFPPAITPIGASCNASIFYQPQNETEKIKVTFVRGENQKICQITVPVTKE